MLARIEHNEQPTGACTAGVKVRITRQRMVGEIARHSGADIAAGVTPGRSWHSTQQAILNGSHSRLFGNDSEDHRLEQ